MGAIPIQANDFFNSIGIFEHGNALKVAWKIPNVNKIIYRFKNIKFARFRKIANVNEPLQLKRDCYIPQVRSFLKEGLL